MRERLVVGAALAATLWPVSALAQRAVRPKDAEAPVVAPAQPAAPTSGPATDATAARKRKATAAPPAAPAAKPAPAPVFKDDIDDARSVASMPAALSSGGGEAVMSRTLESDVFTLHVRPATLQPGKLAEMVVEVSEVMDPPDPEYGERKPVTGEALVAHVEGVGRFLLHPIESNAGGYGFHFTPTGSGSRDVEISRLDGRPGLTATFHVPVGEAPGKGVDVRDWSAPSPERYEAVSVAPPQKSDEEE